MMRSLLGKLVLALILLPSVAISAVNDFNYEQLRSLIEVNKLTTIEQLLEQLPVEYKDSYTLVYQSASLHGASLQQPRAVLYGKDAKLIITFNGDPAQRRYQHLEILQYRPALNEFEFRGIEFRNGEVAFSEKNPALCLKCHGPSPRPLWGSYDYNNQQAIHWPGLYGSKHDSPLLNPAERSAYQQFRASQPQHPRFQHLTITHPDSDWYLYGKGAFQHRFRPNNRLGNLLARHNARRIAGHIFRSDYFQSYPATTLLSLTGCEQAKQLNFEQIIFKQFRQRFPTDKHGDLHRHLDQTLPQYRIMFMMEKILTGLDVYTWNLSQRGFKGGRRFDTGIRTIDALIAARVLPSVGEILPWYTQYYQPENNQYLYDTFRPGYYKANVAPGGVGAIYDRLGSYFNEQRVAAACPRLYRQAMKELIARVEHG